MTRKSQVQVQPKAKALDRVIPYTEKLRLMTLEVLREESGRELESAAQWSGEEFDWKVHNAEFRKDYKETPLSELIQKAKLLYGLADLDAIKVRRKLHKQQRAERISAKSA
ncbi:MAG: hypothetical protein KME31_12595 [Tolypothrix carrinoi HA7290-LM1]|nr:hypothetical protein [Tolypothrix carrinoi HA7290-LM1]